MEYQSPEANEKSGASAGAAGTAVASVSEDSLRGMLARGTDFNDRRVCVTPCGGYGIEMLDEIIERQSRILGLSDYITVGCTVVIKPNFLLRRRPEDATTTHPEVIAAVIRAVKRRGAGKVIIAESSGGLYNRTTMPAIYNTCGVAEICRREGAELNMDFTASTVYHPGAALCRQFDIITPVIKADVLINICKLKTHCMTGLSGAVKNLFGCVPGLTKPEMHCQYPEKSEFQQMIADLCTLVRPQLSFMDAVECMEGDGPSGGNKRFVGAVLAGRNPFAVDIAACKLINVQPGGIYMLSHGMERGLCPRSVRELEIIGDLEPLIVRDFKQPRSKGVDFLDYIPKPLRPVVKKVEKSVAPKPRINTAACIGCGKCAESCPQRVISIKEKKAVIEYSGCIRCYCCHEMCPARAIDIKRFGAFRM